MFEKQNIYLTRIPIPRGCGPYRYIVTAGGTSWLAFRTLKGLREFLKVSNLRPKCKGKRGKGERAHCIFTLEGNYFENIGEWDIEKFNSIRADAERIAYSNGTPTLWKYVHIDAGGCIAYHLNPNVKNRPEFDRTDVLDNQGPVTEHKRGVL